MSSGNGTSRWRLFALLILPFLHLCACAVAAHGPVVDLQPIIVIDTPLSFLVLALAGWASPHLLIWFGILGTLWWYLVALFVELEARKLILFFRARRR
jgi:hypothetical protein